ncbi:hypothetical protein BJ546DRAFT_1062534 [Cryomyces antarcticus]
MGAFALFALVLATVTIPTHAVPLPRQCHCTSSPPSSTQYLRISTSDAALCSQLQPRPEHWHHSKKHPHADEFELFKLTSSTSPGTPITNVLESEYPLPTSVLMQAAARRGSVSLSRGVFLSPSDLDVGAHNQITCGSSRSLSDSDVSSHAALIVVLLVVLLLAAAVIVEVGKWAWHRVRDLYFPQRGLIRLDGEEKAPRLSGELLKGRNNEDDPGMPLLP